MATMNLYAELLSELGTIGNDESLLRKVLSAVKALKIHTGDERNEM